jgi:hypothetical protein
MQSKSQDMTILASAGLVWVPELKIIPSFRKKIKKNKIKFRRGIFSCYIRIGE